MNPSRLNATALLLVLLLAPVAAAENENDLTFTIETDVAQSGFDGETCWVHARAGTVPAAVSDDAAGNPLVVMTMQKLLLSGSDVFYALHESRSSDLGKTWSEPTPIDSFARQAVPAGEADVDQWPTGASIAPQLLQSGDETTVCDFTPKWHASSQRLLGIGQTVWYRDNRVLHERPRGVAYAVYAPEHEAWSDWKTVELPDEAKFQNAGSGSVQRVDLPGGDILLPIYFKRPDQRQYSVTVCHCRFDGHTLHYVEHGNELTIDAARGLYEPSLTKFRGRYYLTMRNDHDGYVSTSDDGLRFNAPRRWIFDDGSDLGNYNTQQHWVTHSDGLYLVYTRRGAGNDHVFRHRAPLFIARVDPQQLHVIRQSEQVVVAERGARLGNFGVVDVSPEETWVTAAEWMQPQGVQQHGSDNSVFVAKLKWSRPNQRLLSETQDLSQTQDDEPANAADPWETIQWYFQPPLNLQNQFGDYASPLQFANGETVRTAADWQRRRREILEQWQSLLGEWPPLITEPDVEILATERREDYTQHKIRFRWIPEERAVNKCPTPFVPSTRRAGSRQKGSDTFFSPNANEMTVGYLLIPDGPGPHPAVVTVFYEPETAAGLGRANLDFALQLTRRGFVSLSIGTTKATAARTYSLYYPSIEDAQVEPLSMLGYAAANAWHVLASRPEVDPQRIGIVGHSFGGKWALFAACLFDKFACAAWSDPGIVFDPSRSNVNYWEPWYLGYHSKPWRKRGMITAENPARGLYPELVAAGHDLHELHALMAPRPLLVSGGSVDPIERWEALNHTVEVNRILGYRNRVAMTNRPDHGLNEESNEVIYSFFEHFLK